MIKTTSNTTTYTPITFDATKVYDPEVIWAAELLHYTFCHASHVDVCSWEYENWTSVGTHSERIRWLYKVEYLHDNGVYVPDGIKIFCELYYGMITTSPTG